MYNHLFRLKKDSFEKAIEDFLNTISDSSIHTTHIEDLLNFQDSETLTDSTKKGILKEMKRDEFLNDIFENYVSIEAKELFEEYTEEELKALGLEDYRDIEEI